MTERNFPTHGDTSSRFTVGAPVYVKNFSVRGDSWIHGHITHQLGRMMYTVRLDNNFVVRRHQNMIRPGNILKSTTPDPDIYDDFLLNKAILEQVSRAAPHLSVAVPEEDPDEPQPDVQQQQPDVQQQQKPTRQQRRVVFQVPLRRSLRIRHPPRWLNNDS